MAVVVSGSSTPSPSARACSDLKADVASYVNAPNSARALAKAEDCLRVAVAKLNTETWPWMLVYQDITLVASTFDYDLVSAFLSPRHCFVLDSNGKHAGSLHYYDPKSFSIYYDASRSDGSPSTYTVHNAHEYGTISLNNAPTSEYASQYPTLRLWYYQRVQPCGGSTTAIDVPHEVGEWVAWYAKSLMAAHHDPQKFSIASQVEGTMWRQLIRQKTNNELSDWS